MGSPWREGAAGGSLGVVFGQGLPHTHSPFLELVDLLTSPGGGLLWDVFLLALGIYVTVVILQRYFDRQEEKRWRPARQYLYRQLISHTDWLLNLMPSDPRERQPGVEHRVGPRRGTTNRYGRDFGRSLARLNARRLSNMVEQFANNPRLLEVFKQNFDTSLGYAGAVFLAREPALNKMLNELQEWILRFEGNLEGYREARKSGVAGAGSIAFQQACVSLKEMMRMGYRLRSWLAERTAEIKPSSSNPA
jgi:hypothetical protein